MQDSFQRRTHKLLQQPVMQRIPILLQHQAFLQKNKTKKGRLCLQDQFQLSLHGSHGNSIKPLSDCLIHLSKQVREQQAIIITNYRPILRSEKNKNILQSFDEYDEHLDGLERFLRSQKYQIQNEMKQILDEIQSTLTLTQQNMFDRLDSFFDSYNSAYKFAIEQILIPLQPKQLDGIIQEDHFDRLSSDVVLMQIKSSLFICKQISLGDRQIQAQKIQMFFSELNRAHDQLPCYKNDTLNSCLEESVKTLQQFFTQNLIIPEFQVIESILPPQVKVLDENDNITIKSVDGGQSNLPTIVNNTLYGMDVSTHTPLEVETPTIVTPFNPFPLFFQENSTIKDSRMISNISINQLIQKAQGRKLKIKKKLTLDVHISSIALITQNLLAIGGKDGSLKLLDLNTNKVSFYPNAFISHFDEVICLQILQNNISQVKIKSGRFMIRLASSSMDTNIIIWTLGENNIAYPERKLIGFERPIVRMVDLEDGSHLAGVDDIGCVYIINYHDNRVPYSFKSKRDTKIVEFFYSNQQQKLISVSDSNTITVYSLLFKQMQLFSLAPKMIDNTNNRAQLLTSCELSEEIRGPNIGQITCCCPIISNGIAYLCYGNTQGNLIIFDIKKNTILYNKNVYSTSILEIGLFNTVIDPQLKKQGFMLIGLAEKETKIKALILNQDQKINVIEQFGQLIEECSTIEGELGSFYHYSQLKSKRYQRTRFDLNPKISQDSIMKKSKQFINKQIILTC